MVATSFSSQEANRSFSGRTLWGSSQVAGTSNPSRMAAQDPACFPT
jgi:hypothetical protein